MKTRLHLDRDNVIFHDDGAIAKAGCVVLNDAGQILLITNSKRTEYALPKGHAEPGESLENVAVRETFEETGYPVAVIGRLDDLEYTHGKSGVPIRVSLWLARPAGSQANDHDERCEWVAFDRALGLLAPNVSAFLSRQNLAY